MLIKVKNPDYYRDRIRHYEAQGLPGYEARTLAYFDQQNPRSN